MMRKNIVALIFSVSVYVVSANSTTKKDMYTNILKNRSNDIQNNPLNNNNPSEYKLTDGANKHVDNIRNKNRQINLKMAQRPNDQRNSDFSKLAEKLRRYKVNVTAAKQDGPEITAPNMIPIFRPLLNNIRNVHQELVKTNENTSNTDLKSNVLENDEEVLDAIGNQTENDIANYSTNEIERISLLKQQYAQDYQQTTSEINPIGIRIDEEYFEKPYVNDKEDKVLELTDILSPNKVISSALNIKTIDKSKATIQPQFKIEFIPANHKLSLNQNTQNLFTSSENLNPSNDDLNTKQNVMTHNLGFPNNMIIKSMKFVPLSEMQNQLVPDTAQNVITQTALQNPCETFIERPLLEENNAIFRTDNHQMNPVTSSTRFNIPCFTATDILEDLGAHNQNRVQPIMYPKSENLVTNLACNTESGTDIEEESLAIIFKAKDISLLKVYGDILKKITLTVLVPYHISKLIT